MHRLLHMYQLMVKKALLYHSIEEPKLQLFSALTKINNLFFKKLEGYNFILAG